jgi:hypothetical protein
MEQFYEIKDNTVVVTTVARSNIEWASTPDYIRCNLTKGTLETAQMTAQFLEGVGYFKAENLYGIWCELLSINEDEVFEKSEDILFPLVELEPEYSVSGASLIVYNDGDLKAVVHLKHSDEEIWAWVGNVKDLLQKLEEHEDGND